MLLAIGGPAGSGKTTLANALARELKVPHLDFDDVTLPVVHTGRERLPDLTEAQLLGELRAERYSLLARATGEAVLAGQRRLIVSAPFTTEAVNLRAWTNWRLSLGVDIATVFVWLVLDPETRRARMQTRGSSRDAELLASGEPLPAAVFPSISAVLVEASRPIAEQVSTVLTAIS